MLLVLALFFGGCGLDGVKSYRKNKDCPKKAPFFLWQSCFYCYFIVISLLVNCSLYGCFRLRCFDDAAAD